MKNELERQKVEWPFTGRGIGGNGKLFNGYKVSVLQNEKSFGAWLVTTRS